MAYYVMITTYVFFCQADNNKAHFAFSAVSSAIVAGDNVTGAPGVQFIVESPETVSIKVSIKVFMDCAVFLTVISAATSISPPAVEETTELAALTVAEVVPVSFAIAPFTSEEIIASSRILVLLMQLKSVIALIFTLPGNSIEGKIPVLKLM